MFSIEHIYDDELNLISLDINLIKEKEKEYFKSYNLDFKNGVTLVYGKLITSIYLKNEKEHRQMPG